MEGTEGNMKRIAVASLVVMVSVAACRSSEEPKATSVPAPSPSVGSQYGETLRGGIDKAKDIQEKMGERAHQLDETVKQNTPSQDE